MSAIIQLLITGFFLGAIYALVALGLSIIWGVTRIINVAHGEFIVLGAYITYFLYRFQLYHHVIPCSGPLRYICHDPFLYLIISGILVGLVGVLIQMILYNRLLGEEPLITLTLAFGVSLILSTLMIIFFSGDYRFLNTTYTTQAYHIGGYNIRKGDIGGFIVSVSVFSFTYLFMERTNTGRAIRAVAQDREAALLMGVNDKQIYMAAMFLSAFIAGIAGGLIAILYTFYPESGGSWLGWSFAISVLAGLGNVQGVLLSGIIVGMARGFTSYRWHGLEASVGLILMILVMLVRPRGLFGRSEE